MQETDSVCNQIRENCLTWNCSDRQLQMDVLTPVIRQCCFNGANWIDWTDGESLLTSVSISECLLFPAVVGPNSCTLNDNGNKVTKTDVLNHDSNLIKGSEAQTPAGLKPKLPPRPRSYHIQAPSRVLNFNSRWRQETSGEYLNGNLSRRRDIRDD